MIHLDVYFDIDLKFILNFKFLKIGSRIQKRIQKRFISTGINFYESSSLDPLGKEIVYNASLWRYWVDQHFLIDEQAEAKRETYILLPICSHEMIDQLRFNLYM